MNRFRVHTRSFIGWDRQQSHKESGQAFAEILIFIALISLLLSSIRIFSKVALADEAQIAEARWLGFHCAYRDNYCSQLPETHSGLPVAALESESRRIEKASFDAGSSLLRRNAQTTDIISSPLETASKFGLDVQEGLYRTTVSTTVELIGQAERFALPKQLDMSPRSIALLSGTWSMSATAEGETETLDRVRLGITLPGQGAVDTLLRLNEVVRDVLRYLGLETLQTKWSEREIKALDRNAAFFTNSASTCPACVEGQ